jgi:tetratricopeptide (TPR) repeat protein
MDWLTKNKKIFFTLVTILIPVLFFVFLEIFLRIISYAGDTDLIISGPPEQSKYYTINPNAAARYFSKYEINLQTAYDVFLKQKPANGYRIFVLGGSTAAGYPYGNNLMFSRILNQQLNEVFPGMTVEVINTAAPAINTYTQLDFLNEILDYKPDALLIYSGHNEYYGALGVGSIESLGRCRWFITLYLKLQKFKSFILLRNIITGVLSFFQTDTDDISGTLMERMVEDQKIPLGSELYEEGKKQFAANLRDILKQARAANVRVLLSELVSNVRDQKPFISVAGASELTANQAYSRAEAAEKKGDYQQAKKYYYRAKDLDALRFRSPEDFNRIIHNLGREFNVPVVPMKEYFEKESPHGLIDNTLMLEHLHPNSDGYFIMADAFFNTMRDQKMIDADWDSTRIPDFSSFKKTWGYTSLDSVYAALRIQILKGGWPFQPKSAPNKALLAFRRKNIVDSIAVRIIQDKLYNLEHAHVDLAVYYVDRNIYPQAFAEYNALVCLTPYNVSPYIKAAEVLIKAGKLNQAFPILNQSLQLENTVFAQKWMGQILLNQNRIDDAIPYLERAYQADHKDPQLLFNLSGAYALSSEFEKARKLLYDLEKIDPDFPNADNLEDQLDRILGHQKNGQ